MYKIISFYTDNYKEIAKKHLIPSLQLLNIPYNIIEIEDLGSWEKNTKYKPYFIKEQLSLSNGNLVFIDCDAKVNNYPELFDNIPQEFDIGVHTIDPLLLFGHNRVPKHFASGTLYIKNNEKILALIDKWISFLPNFRWEQKALEMAVKESPNIKTYDLPRSYCYIETQPNGCPPATILQNPIIVHYQASREKRNG